MRPTQFRLSGHPDPKNGKYIGDWGTIGGANKQKGIVSWGLSANRQNPFAGAAHDAVFNVFRRTKSQILFWLIPAVGGYYMMDWAIHRNEYLNSKQGRAEFADEE